MKFEISIDFNQWGKSAKSYKDYTNEKFHFYFDLLKLLGLFLCALNQLWKNNNIYPDETSTPIIYTVLK